VQPPFEVHPARQHILMEDISPFLRLDRPRLAAALAERFAEWLPAADTAAVAAATRLWARGGRAAALERLAAIDPVAYARTRNHVGGAVTRLSPWLRHGLLSTAEVRDRALAVVRQPEDAAKLVSELGWREYWRQVHAALGTGIRRPVELPAQPARRPGVHAEVPADVLAAATGMACIDEFVRRLHDTGWLHNHERMWLASWLVHVRGVRWQAGADWFLARLVDGDPASNHLSWQWVAGTFAAKPYIFNRENLESHTAAAHCGACPVAGRCDVEGSYEDLSARLFATPAPVPRPPLRIRPAAPWPGSPGPAPRRPLVWLTLDAAGPTSPAAVAHADAPRVFVVDPAWLAEERPALQRLVFLCECLADSPGVTVVVGDPRDVLRQRAREAGCDGVAVAETPCPRTRAAAEAIRDAADPLRLAVHAWPRFCDAGRARDLGRFSRFWAEAGPSALRGS
jgi:deoxyribodipyrimidine photo-lyase